MPYKLEGLAKEIFTKKYKQNEDNIIEDMWARIAISIASVETDSGLWRTNFYNLLEDCKFIPGGRISAGAGTKNNFLLNCAALPVEDSIDGIYEAIKKAAVLAKCQYGSGFSFSSIRPKDDAVSRGGAASGPVSFMKVFDASGAIIETGGNRRAAAIGVLRVDHPDIFEFIDAKRQEGVLTQFNISVALTNEFLEAVKSDSDFDLVFKGKVYKTVKATDIWKKLTYSGYNFNDPGILMIDEVNKFNNGYYLYEIETTNPCFTGDMQLLTTEGYKSFESLEDTEVNIVSFTGEVSKGKVWCSGEKSTVKIDFWNKEYSSITCTPDHRFMLADGTECPASELAGKSVMPFSQIKKEFKRTPFMAGFIQGDGCTGRLLSNNHNGLEVNIGAKDLEVAEFLNADVIDAKWYSVEAKDIAVKYNLSSEPLPTRNMPKLSLEQEELLEFLSGLWSANGCVIRGHRVALKTTNRILATELQSILKGLSIDSYITTNKPALVTFSNGEYLCKPSYDLNITRIKSIITFAKNISFIQKYKQTHLQELIISKAPKVSKVTPYATCKVYDFSEPLHNWGVVENVIAHNCGEIPLPPFGVCDLGNLNLVKYIKKPFSGKNPMTLENFDHINYRKDVATAVRFLDNVLDVSEYPYDEIRNRAQGDRRIGLNGVAGLASALAMLELPYDSKDARTIAAEIQFTCTCAAYEASIELAKEKGSFPNFDKEKYLAAPFIKTLPKKIQEGIAEYGIRNIALLTIPPVGTGSILSGNISNGLEPIFALEYNRKVRQPDQTTKEEAVEDYAWKLYKKTSKFDPACIAPEFFKTSRDISPKNHIDMQACLQKYIDGSISKTVNMPESTTIKAYEEALWYAIESGCKGFTSFREGTREGVLSTKDEGKKVVKAEEKIKAAEPKKKRPRKLIGTTYKIADDKGNIYITINDIEEKGKLRPFEIFINSNGENSDNSVWYKALGKLMSAVMRRTDDCTFIIRDLQGIFGASGFFTDGKYVQSQPQMIGNILEEHYRDINPETSKEVKYTKCPECGEHTYLKEGGCSKCLSCGYSSCG